MDNIEIYMNSQKIDYTNSLDITSSKSLSMTMLITSLLDDLTMEYNINDGEYSGIIYPFLDLNKSIISSK